MNRVANISSKSVKTDQQQSEYIQSITAFVLELLDNSNTVPGYLAESLPDGLRPKRLLQELSREELDLVRKGKDSVTIEPLQPNQGISKKGGNLETEK